MMFEKYFAFAMAAIILAMPSPAESASLATLAGDKVTVAFEVNTTGVHFAVTTTEQNAKWVSIAIGTRMVGSHSYVAWFDEAEVGHLDSYGMTSHSSSGVKKVEGEAMTEVVVEKDSTGLVSFSFRRPLEGMDQVPTISLEEPLPLVWGLGNSWGTELTGSNQHFESARRVTRVTLDITPVGGNKTGGDTVAVTTVTGGADGAYKAHGYLMFASWGVLVPAGVFSARFLKMFKGGLWFKLHKAFMALALVLMSAGLIVVVMETEDKNLDHFDNKHTYYGIFAISLAFVQPINAFLRPNKPEPAPKGEVTAAKAPIVTPRRAWEVAHRVVAMAGALLAVLALFSGLHQIHEKGMSADTEDDLKIALGVWIALLVALPLARAVQLACMAPQKADESLEDGNDREMDMATLNPKPLNP